MLRFYSSWRPFSEFPGGRFLSRRIAKKEHQLQRFIEFFRIRYGHERVSAVTKRDVKAWIDFFV